MSFAGAIATDENHILTAVDKAAAGQFQYQGLVNCRNGTEIKVIQALNYRETSSQQSQFLSMLIPLDYFSLQQSKQIILEGPVIGCRLFSQPGIVLSHHRKTQSLKEAADLEVISHVSHLLQPLLSVAVRQ